MKNVHTIHCVNPRQDKFEKWEMNPQSSFQKDQSFYFPKIVSQTQTSLNVKPLITIPSFPKFSWDQTNNVAANRDLISTNFTSDIYMNHQQQHVNSHYRCKNVNAEYVKEYAKFESELIF